jgi:hypothetical protein
MRGFQPLLHGCLLELMGASTQLAICSKSPCSIAISSWPYLQDAISSSPPLQLSRKVVRPGSESSQTRVRTGPHLELVVSGPHDHTTSVHVLKCVPQSAECCIVWPCVHFCMELPIHTSKIDRHFFYFKKHTLSLNLLPRNYALYARNNDEKDGWPLKEKY